MRSGEECVPHWRIPLRFPQSNAEEKGISAIGHQNGSDLGKALVFSIGLASALYGVGTEHVAFSTLGFLAFAAASFRERGMMPFQVLNWGGFLVCMYMWFQFNGLLFVLGAVFLSAVIWFGLALLAGTFPGSR